MRYYDVTGGSIRVDGKDIRDVTQGSLRNVLGVVPQDPLLFNASVMENLRYAKLSASDDEVFEACRAAAIHDKIASFPDGYDTNVDENGVRLSGGEIQRLAIARAFLKNPPILILDEATSAVDTETEAEIQEALRRLSVKRTTFVIAHRLSMVISADQILVLQDGEVVERGTHQKLLDKGGRYHSLWHKQLGDSSEGSDAGGDEEPLIDDFDASARTDRQPFLFLVCTMFTSRLSFTCVFFYFVDFLQKAGDSNVDLHDGFWEKKKDEKGVGKKKVKRARLSRQGLVPGPRPRPLLDSRVQ